MERRESQSGPEMDFELHGAVSATPDLADGEAAKDVKSVNSRRWYTRLAAGLAMLVAAGCGPSDSKAGENAAQFADGQGESAENAEQQAQLQLQLNEGKKAALSLFFGENKIYNFKLTSADKPGDVVEIGSSGEKVELLEGAFKNPTSGYTVEAFDDKGAGIPINLTKQPGTIYGPDRF